jgi:uncharacterized protein (DUF427 family)
MARSAPMKATWKGKTIAQSDTTLEVHGYVYFPRDAVRMDLLKAAEKSESDLACPHGVQFYDLADGKKRSLRAAWSYEKPSVNAMRSIDHWVAFWEDVKVGA